MTIVATGFGDKRAISVDDDPLVTAVNATKGSIIIYNDELYCKMSDGENTDVQLQASALATHAEAEAGSSTVPKLWTPEGLVHVKKDFISLETASFTAVDNTIHVCDTNAASGDIVVTMLGSPIAGNEFFVRLKTDHATRKLTVNGETFIIAGEWGRFVYDGAAWNNFVHLIPCHARVTRDAAQSINDSTITFISFDAEDYDNSSLATTGTTPIVIRRAGLYKIICGWVSALIDDAERLSSRIRSAGAESRISSAFSSLANGTVSSNAEMTETLAAGDTVRMRVFHTEGAAINTETGVFSKPFLEVVEIV